MIFCNRVFLPIHSASTPARAYYAHRDLGLLISTSRHGGVQARLSQCTEKEGTLFEVWGSGKTRALALRSLRNRLKALGRIGGLV
jgi:hypothetical protein